MQRLVSGAGNIRGILAGDAYAPELAFSPDGQLLASAGGRALLARVAGFDDSVAYLWDVNSRQLVAQLRPDKKSPVKKITFSPDSNILAVAYLNGAIVLWDVVTQRPTGEPLRSVFGLESIAFSPGGDYLLGSSGREEVMLWDVRLRKPAGFHVPQFASQVREVAYSYDGRGAALTSDHGVVVWEIGSGRIFQTVPSINGQKVTAFAFHPDGKHWLLGTEHGHIQFYDPATKKALDNPMIGMNELFGFKQLRISANGNTLIANTGMSEVTIWDLAASKPLSAFAASPANSSMESTFAVSPDGKLIAQGQTDGAILLLDYSQPRSLGARFDIEPVQRQDGSLFGVFNAITSKTAAATAVLWDAAERRKAGEPIRSDQGEITALALSPDGRVLATGGPEGSIILWDVVSRRPLGKRIHTGDEPLKHIVFSPDGKLLASAGGSFMSANPLTLWDVARREAIARPFGEEGGWRNLAFSPDGRLLAAVRVEAQSGSEIRLYDLKDQKPGDTFTHADNDARVVFGSDNRQLLSIGRTSIVTWDVAGRRRVDESVRMPGIAIEIALSPDGKILAHLGPGGLTLFERNARRQLGDTIEGGRVNPLGVSGSSGFSSDGKRFVAGGVFSPDGKWIVARGTDTPFVWQIDVEAWLSRACELANRNLTLAEWRQLAGSEFGYVTACPQFAGPGD